MDDVRDNVTWIGVQFTKSDTLLALLVEQIDDNEFRSKIYETKLSTNSNAHQTKILIEYDGWITAFWCDERNRFFFGTSDGEIFIYSKDGFQEFDPTERAISSLLGLSSSEVYAASLDGKVFAWDGEAWQDLQARLPSAALDLTMDRSRRLYVSGEQGLLSVHEKEHWRTIPLPTNLRLGGVDAIGNSTLVGGDKGICFRIERGDLVEQIDGANNGIYGFTRYNKTIFAACSANGVMILENGEFLPFFDLFQPYGVASSENWLAGFGEDEIYVYNGEEWSRINWH